jgi:carbamoyltransferase
MRVLGLSFGFHDSAAALVSNGIPLAAAQEERFSRKKNDDAFPLEAVRHCLAVSGLQIEDLDAVVYHEQPMVKFNRIVENWLRGYPNSGKQFDQTVARWIKDRRFQVPELISEMLGIDINKVFLSSHHLSHAASAYFASPFEEAAIITIDGVGEVETTSVSVGKYSNIKQIKSAELPNSIGLFYSAFTSFLGFKVNEGEYKVMGMSAFGEPLYKDELLNLFNTSTDSLFELDQTLFSFNKMLNRPYTQEMIDRFGPPRKYGSPFATVREHLPEGLFLEQEDDLLEASRHYANIAASVQACTEEMIIKLVRKAIDMTGLRNVVMAGGVALNSLANGRLLREEGVKLFVQPAAGDSGCALGAALMHSHQNKGRMISRWRQTKSAFGRTFTQEDALAAAERSGFTVVDVFSNLDEYLKKVATLISEGNVIGWLDGASEWGPRALGHRSILADPRNAATQAIVNEKIKYREPFRPFAPAVPVEQAEKFFDFGEDLAGWRGQPWVPEVFMLAVHPVKTAAKGIIPAVTHADGTARVQLVHADEAPKFYGLIKAFGDLTGVPVLLNTSFNLNGEPIVDTPEDALRTFSLSGLDYLCMEGVIVSKTLAQGL